MVKVVRFYKPSKGKREFYKEYVFHKLEVMNTLVKSWERQYGRGFVEMVTV